MKIVRMGEPQVIMSNPESRHNYFAWPTVARLQNGKIAVVASGYRLRHACPFGKTVISYSENEGETYTAPAPIFDTVLDDRDGGILPFGEKGIIVTSFNNVREFQRKYAETSYDTGYLDLITDDEEKEALGALFRISNDCGVTFGEIHKSPITSPHGPIELHDGTLLWIGRTFNPKQTLEIENDFVQAYKINLDGTMEFVGKIENITIDGIETLSCEPHSIVLEDGTILTHIRVQNKDPKIFTIFQSESHDNGKTWSTPRQLLPLRDGAPPHLFMHSSGMLICTYADRRAPHPIKAMFSKDNGQTWDYGYDIYVNKVVTWDFGYPSTIEMADGSLLTVFYTHMSDDGPAVVQQRWRFEDNG